MARASLQDLDTSLLCLVLSHGVACVRHIVVLRRVCKLWARTLQQQLHHVQRYCCTTRERLEEKRYDREVRRLQPFDAQHSWLMDCSGCPLLRAGPPTELSVLPLWQSMTPLLQHLHTFEISSIQALCVESTAVKTSLLRLIASLAWLPAPEQLTVFPDQCCVLKVAYPSSSDRASCKEWLEYVLPLQHLLLVQHSHERWPNRTGVSGDRHNDNRPVLVLGRR